MEEDSDPMKRITRGSGDMYHQFFKSKCVITARYRQSVHEAITITVMNSTVVNSQFPLQLSVGPQYL